MRLIAIVIAWVAGLVLSASAPQPVWLSLIAVALAIGLIKREWRSRAVLIAFLALGALRMNMHPTTSDIAAYNSTGGLTIEGFVVTDPDVRDDRIQFQVETETITRAGQTLPTSGLVLVQAARGHPIRYGDKIRATGLLITPAEYDTFSYADFLARSGIFSIMRNAAVETVSSGYGNPFYSALFDLRHRAQDLIAQNLPEPHAGLLTGILLGNERGLSPQISDAFSTTGAAHIIAISGFNMALLSGIVIGALKRTPLNRWAAAGLAITVIVLYSLLVGASPAVVRAAIMSGLLIFGEALRRKTYVPTSLAFAALVLSLLTPTVIWDISFQLSFFATLGLALFATPLTTRFEALLEKTFTAPIARTLNTTLKEPVIVTVASLTLTLPLTVLYFNKISLVVLIVNLLIVPVQAFILFSGGLALITAFVLPAVAQILFWFCMLLLGWTIGVVRLFATLPFAQIEFSLPARLIFLFFVIVIGIAIMQASQPLWWINFKRLIRSRLVTSSAFFGAFSILALIGIIYISRPDGKLHVWMLDAGHSNAVLIQSPNGAQILIDGGRFPSRLLTAIGEQIPFNDREIELLVMTQPDPFQYGALPSLLERYDIGAVLTHGQPNLAPEYLALQEQFTAHEVVTVKAGYSAEFSDGVKLEVLHPQTQPTLNNSLDEYTLVLRLSYGNVSFLFTSDLSQEGQFTLLESGYYPVASVMTLPQHGTQHSLNEDFLKAVQPQLILLQSDAANLRGDPNPDVMAMVKDLPVFRTDHSGTIHIESDGIDLWVYEERHQKMP